MMGEYPDLPPSLIRSLRQRVIAVTHRIEDAVWTRVAEGCIFEGFPQDQER